ncbi:MAG: hypothetical protein HC859_14165, partial [Bacteroidia bacterium]|nr:hypothetical protein [Bacteroidia bacterium]
MQRRTTPASSKYGYHRTVVDGDYGLIKADTYARMANVVSPSTDMTRNGEPTLGILVSIGYSTGGKTVFNFDGSGGYPHLASVQDKDERGETISTREVEYLDQIVTFNPVYLSYQESRLEFTNDWVKYSVRSSTPQNSATLTKGSVAGNRLTRIYNGTRTNHAGWEEFSYTSPSIVTDAAIHSQVVPSVIKSDPVDTDRNGDPITNGITDQFPFSPPIDNDHLRGLLARHETFDAAGQKINSVINEYDVNPGRLQTTKLYMAFHGGL